MTTTEEPVRDASDSRKVMDASTFKVSDYLKGVVTLPSDTVSVCLDGATGWEYHRLLEEINELTEKLTERLKQVTQDKAIEETLNPVPRTIAEAPEPEPTIESIMTAEERQRMDSMMSRKKSLATRLSDAMMTVHLTALYPKQENAIQKRNDAQVAEHFKDKETPSQQERDDYKAEQFARATVVASIKKLVLPNGDEIVGPISMAQLEEFESMVDADEWSKVYVMYRELATRAAIREATVDAGFSR